MKTKILAVAAFTAISLSLISCDWLFGKKDNATKSFSLNGKWIIENIADSSHSHRNDIGMLALAMLSKDSLPLTTEFMPDSTLIFGSDTMHYYLDTAIQTIFVKDDTATIALSIKSQTDSSMQLYAPADSLIYELKRK